MPPQENKNNNIPTDTFKITGIDPVFKGNPNQQSKTENQPTAYSPSNVLNNQKYTPSQPAVPIPKAAESANINNVPKSLVRTYKGDLESAINKNHVTSINIAIAENEKLHSQIQMEQKADLTAEEQPNKSSTSKIAIFISIFLVIAGVAGVYITYSVKSTEQNQVATVQELPFLITTEKKEELNIDNTNKNNVTNILSSKINEAQISPNSLFNVYLTTGTSSKRLVNSGEFISLVRLHIPDQVRRTLLPDFIVGTYNLDRNLPFVIFKTSSYENTYAGMISWERDMEKDFKILFKLPGYDYNGGIIAEITATTTKQFEDGILTNKDVRRIKDENGNTLLIYGIVDRETIIITTTDNAFKELVNRLNKEKTLKR